MSLGFELPKINPLVDKEVREKLLGDTPTLDDILPGISMPKGFGLELSLFGLNPFGKEEENSKKEED